MNTTKFFHEVDCVPFEQGMHSRDNNELMLWVGINWAVIGICACMGPLTIRVFSTITVVVKFALLITCMVIYMLKAQEMGVAGYEYYFDVAEWVNADGSVFNPQDNSRILYKDAYNQVIFSIGLCVGVFTAYGSY